jgi:hypothetical protein
VSENDRPCLSILISGTSKSDKVTDLENTEAVEAREYIFSPEILELTMLFLRAHCRCEAQGIKSLQVCGVSNLRE